jgi:hypothetical protein
MPLDEVGADDYCCVQAVPAQRRTWRQAAVHGVARDGGAPLRGIRPQVHPLILQQHTGLFCGLASSTDVPRILQGLAAKPHHSKRCDAGALCAAVSDTGWGGAHLPVVVQHVVPAGRRAVRQHPARVLQPVARKQHHHPPADRRGACTRDAGYAKHIGLEGAIRVCSFARW